MLDLVVSADDVVAQLQLAVADVAIEQQLPAPATPRQVEAIPALTDALVRSADVSLPSAIVTGLAADEQDAILTRLKDKVAEVWKDFGEWRKTAFSPAADKLKTIGQKVLDAARDLGVSAEHLIGRLQRRVMTAVVSNAVLPPFRVTGQGDQAVTFAASDATVTSTVRSAPSLASLDLSGVVELLSGILSLELDVTVRYGAGS